MIPWIGYSYFEEGPLEKQYGITKEIAEAISYKHLSTETPFSILRIYFNEPGDWTDYMEERLKTIKMVSTLAGINDEDVYYSLARDIWSDNKGYNFKDMKSLKNNRDLVISVRRLNFPNSGVCEFDTGLEITSYLREEIEDLLSNCEEDHKDYENLLDKVTDNAVYSFLRKCVNEGYLPKTFFDSYFWSRCKDQPYNSIFRYKVRTVSTYFGLIRPEVIYTVLFLIISDRYNKFSSRKWSTVDPSITPKVQLWLTKLL